MKYIERRNKNNQTEIKHGQPTKDGHTRKCDIHGEHGILYICEEYSDEIKEKLHLMRKVFIQQCKDGKV
jgi:hypothetical protein